MNIEEAAEYLGVAKSTLQRKVFQEKVPHTKIFGSIRFTPEHLAEIIAAGERRPGAPPRRSSARGSL